MLQECVQRLDEQDLAEQAVTFKAGLYGADAGFSFELVVHVISSPERNGSMIRRRMQCFSALPGPGLCNVIILAFARVSRD
jgi:hypothetical protein